MIASPEVFIAAAERTKHIKLGTGVNSLPYHHPFILADRIVQLDHQTRGRMMFGVGPGQLITDAAMLGIDPNDQRRRMMESFEVIMALFAGENVNVETDWFTCRDAVLQMKPYSNFEVACASSMSPSGSKLAGRFGTGLISIAATEPNAFEVLDDNYKVWTEEAEINGHVADRLERARRCSDRIWPDGDRHTRHGGRPAEAPTREDGRIRLFPNVGRRLRTLASDQEVIPTLR